jgi:hypothetical protein
MAAAAQPNQRRVRVGRDRRGGGVHLVRVVGVVVIADLARARVTFQQRTILMILEEKPMKSNLIEIDVEVVHRTEKAVLVHTGIKEQAVWLPLSQIEIERNGAFDGIETLTLPEPLALEKGLI